MSLCDDVTARTMAQCGHRGLALGFPGAAGADKSSLLPADPAFAQPLQKGIWSGLAGGHSVEPRICRAPAAPGDSSSQERPSTSNNSSLGTFPCSGAGYPGQDLPRIHQNRARLGNVGFSAFLRGWNRSEFPRRDIPRRDILRRKWWRKGGPSHSLCPRQLRGGYRDKSRRHRNPAGISQVVWLGLTIKETGRDALVAAGALGRCGAAKALQRILQKEFWEFRRLPRKTLGSRQKIQGEKGNVCGEVIRLSSGMKNGIHRPFREENRGA